MDSYTLDVRTVTPHFPGIGRYVHSLARHVPTLLREDESLVLLAQSGGDYPDRSVVHRSETVKTMYTAASPFSLSQQWAIPRLLRRQSEKHGKRALYHSPYYLMPYCVRCPTVLTVYDTISLTHPETVSTRARGLFRIATMLALRASDRVITISDASRRDLLAHFAVDPDNITTVHLGVDDAFHSRSPMEQEKLRTALRLPGDFILYFGSNKPHKNLVRMVDAYALLHRQWPEEKTHLPSLVIAGAWDPRYPEAKQRAEHHRQGDSVRFLGPVDDTDLPALYSAATALIFPSVYEGFGLPVLEAMACGTPVSCSHTSSLPEVAGSAAFYFDPVDVESIAQAIRALVSDAVLRSSLIELGLLRAKGFTWQSTANKTLETYRSVLH